VSIADIFALSVGIPILLAMARMAQIETKTKEREK
jgi:hypothetical protein